MTVHSQIDPPGANSALPTPCEIRVHGIGDHREWSSLGTPTLLARGGTGDVVLAAPPSTPRHSLALFNWSRVTRRVARSLWYVAFPYTLMNVARHMEPDDSRWVVTLHRLFVHMASIALTVLTALWVMTAAETTAVVLQWEGIAGGDPLQQSLVAGAGLLVAICLGRALRKETSEHRVFALLHAGIIALTALSAIVWRPAQIILDWDSYFIAHATYGPDEEGFRRIAEYFESRPRGSDGLKVDQVPHLDALGLLTYICVFVVLALAAVIAFVALLREKRSSRAPLAGSAAAVTAGILLALLTLTVLFRSLPAVLERLDFIPRGPSRETVPDTFLLPVPGRSALDLALPLVALTLAAVLVVTILLFVRFRPGFLVTPVLYAVRSRVQRHGPTERQRRAYEMARERRMRWSHNAVAERLPQALLASLVTYAFTVIALGYLFTRYAIDKAYRDESQFFLEFRGREQVTPFPSDTMADYAIGVGVAVAVAVGLWVVRRGANGPLNKVLASVGDVAGFWPITASPFGGRSYRDRVLGELRGIVHALGHGDVVLVGHSQGSVLAAWCAAYSHEPGTGGTAEADGETDAKRDEPQLRGLITCGSPLMSLYARFFPCHFSPAFFDDLVVGTRVWHNYWRETDPIATAMGQPCIDHLLPDSVSPNGDPARGHSDYWVDAEQVRTTEALVGREPTDSTADAASTDQHEPTG